MCPLLREQVRLLGWVVVGQVAGEDWLEVEVVGVVVILRRCNTGAGDAVCIGVVHGCGVAVVGVNVMGSVKFACVGGCCCGCGG